MKPGPRDALSFFLCLVWLSVFGGGLATASRAAEAPLTPVRDTLSDRAPGRMFAVETPLGRDASLGVPLRKVTPADPAGTDGQQSRALSAVPPVVPVGSAPDAFAGALAPVDALGSVVGHPDVQSLNPASAQTSTPIHPRR